MGQYKIKDLNNYIESAAFIFEECVDAVNEKGGSASTEWGLTALPDEIRNIPTGGGDPDYRYMNGVADRVRLASIGWTDEDILRFEQNAPHYDWQNDQYLVSDENKALYDLDDPRPSLYKDDPRVTFVPNKNMESYFNSARGDSFDGMKYIKGIPFYNYTRTTMRNMFTGCSSLQSIPLLDTSNVTDMYYMFSGCSSLQSIPLLDTSNVVDMNSMFGRCSSLQSIPLLDTSNVVDMNYMFTGCSSLQFIPLFNIDNVSSMNNMFSGCASLTTIPQLDTHNVTNMGSMFYNCTSLTTIPQLDTHNVTIMGSMFSGCTSLTTIPQLDTHNVTSMGSMFYNCTSLTTVEGIDFSGLTSNLTALFGYISSMSKITRFIVNGKINVSISDNYSIKACKNIDYDSIKSILLAASRTDNTDAKTLAFNRNMSDPDGELQNIITICTGKGWTITGLTLN